MHMPTPVHCPAPCARNSTCSGSYGAAPRTTPSTQCQCSCKRRVMAQAPTTCAPLSCVLTEGGSRSYTAQCLPPRQSMFVRRHFRSTCNHGFRRFFPLLIPGHGGPRCLLVRHRRDCQRARGQRHRLGRVPRPAQRRSPRSIPAFLSNIHKTCSMPQRLHLGQRKCMPGISPNQRL